MKYKSSRKIPTSIDVHKTKTIENIWNKYDIALNTTAGYVSQRSSNYDMMEEKLKDYEYWQINYCHKRSFSINGYYIAQVTDNKIRKKIDDLQKIMTGSERFLSKPAQVVFNSLPVADANQLRCKYPEDIFDGGRKSLLVSELAKTKDTLDLKRKQLAEVIGDHLKNEISKLLEISIPSEVPGMVLTLLETKAPQNGDKVSLDQMILSV